MFKHLYHLYFALALILGVGIFLPSNRVEAYAVINLDPYTANVDINTTLESGVTKLESVEEISRDEPSADEDVNSTARNLIEILREFLRSFLNRNR